MKTMQHFFKDYATAAMEGNPKKIAEFYSDHFLVIGPSGSIAFDNNKKFQNWLKSASEFNKKSGLEKLTIRKIHTRTVGKLIKLATVTWGAIYKRTNREIVVFQVHYNISLANNEPKILLYASDDDQKQLMMEKGII